MTKKELETYPTLKKRAEKLKNDIENLRLRDIDSVSGKVKGSSKDFPYTERRFSVEMEVPEERERICKQIEKKKKEIEELQERMRKIEVFIDAIEEVSTKSVFEYRYLQGMSTESVANEYGYTKGRVSQIVSSYFKRLNKTKQVKRH